MCWTNLKNSLLQYSSLSLSLGFFQTLSFRRIPYIVWLLSIDLGLPFFDYAGHYLSVCPIRCPPKSSVSYDNQGSTVQGSSPHKYGQGVWWGILNVMPATIPPIMSGLTLSLKLFLYNVAPSSNVPLTWP